MESALTKTMLHNSREKMRRVNEVIAINDSISKGLDFLNKNQLPYGEFKTYVFPDKTVNGQGKYISTTYITTFVLYSLSFIDDGRVREMNSKALRFLQQEMEDEGIWRYFGTDRSARISNGTIIKFTPINTVPDLDVMACIGYCFRKNGVSYPDNIKTFLENRNSEGVFMTWLLDYPRRSVYDENTIFLQPGENDVCCGVLANILLHLGDTEYTHKSLEYLCNIIEAGKEKENIPYFPDRYVLYYLVSRAYCNGAQSLDKVKELILKRIKEECGYGELHGNVLNAAYTVCIFMNFQSCDKVIEKLIDYILQRQCSDGSWPKERFCDERVRCYGSEELTTAICLEALARCERWGRG